jgi:hypothetical protein
LSDGLAVPTIVPALQSVGAEDWGPKTLNVIVPVGLVPEESVPVSDEAAIAVPAVPVAGALAARAAWAGGAAVMSPNWSDASLL